MNGNTLLIVWRKSKMVLREKMAGYFNCPWFINGRRKALKARVTMAHCEIQKISGKYNTFFTRRFDRENAERIHFASAMTMTGNSEDTISDHPASYLDIAEFISTYGEGLFLILPFLIRTTI